MTWRHERRRRFQSWLHGRGATAGQGDAYLRCSRGHGRKRMAIPRFIWSGLIIGLAVGFVPVRPARSASIVERQRRPARQKRIGNIRRMRRGVQLITPGASNPSHPRWRDDPVPARRKRARFSAERQWRMEKIRRRACLALLFGAVACGDNAHGVAY